MKVFKMMDITESEHRKMGGRLKKIYEQVIFERRVLMFCTILIGISIIVWIVSISTDYWFVVDGGKGIYVPETKRYFYMSHSGIWRICRWVLIIPLAKTINTKVVEDKSRESHWGNLDKQASAWNGEHNKIWANINF